MNFRGLSDKQAEVLGQMCIGNDEGHSPRTLKSLEAKGLLVGYDHFRIAHNWDTGVGVPVKVRRYQVPIQVHIEWCAAHVGNETE